MDILTMGCFNIIDMVKNNVHDLYMAIEDENDEYMRTLSLEHINKGSSEFASTVRQRTTGKHEARFGISEII